MKSVRAFAVQSPALVVAMAALFFSIGSGASYAATSNTRPAAHESQLVSAHAIPHTAIPHVTWKALSIINGWTGNTDGDGVPGYGVNGTGIVYLRGSVAETSGTDEYFAILPPGNRPAHDLYLPIYTNGGTEGSLYIATNGEMAAFYGDASSFSSLAGISFVIGE
jgi:hypothetical protein